MLAFPAEDPDLDIRDPAQREDELGKAFQAIMFRDFGAT